MIRPYKPETLVLGVGLIALGVVWTLANMGALDLLTTLRRWWPAMLILWGALELHRTYSEGRMRRSR
jgi:cell wall-active antibiotic response 4TMS protein YvqF